MFKLFKRRRDKPSVMYGVFQKMGQAVDYRQRQCAQYLNQKTKHITGKRLLVSLVLFCLGFGGGGVYVLWQAVTSPARTVAVKVIHVPRHIVPGVQEQEKNLLLSDAELLPLRSFLHYLDSLQQTPAGKKEYEQLQRKRPGLLDSLAMIQQVYREQLKTK